MGLYACEVFPGLLRLGAAYNVVDRFSRFHRLRFHRDRSCYLEFDSRLSCDSRFHWKVAESFAHHTLSLAGRRVASQGVSGPGFTDYFRTTIDMGRISLEVTQQRLGGEFASQAELSRWERQVDARLSRSRSPYPQAEEELNLNPELFHDGVAHMVVGLVQELPRCLFLAVCPCDGEASVTAAQKRVMTLPRVTGPRVHAARGTYFAHFLGQNAANAMFNIARVVLLRLGARENEVRCAFKKERFSVFEGGQSGRAAQSINNLARDLGARSVAWDCEQVSRSQWRRRG
jgi:hypothetical protein